ncbi:hypothetical protein PHLCEN_2v1217 [Hermanssonia centrifuga]|uniref:Uncharacterized protein n=1 Tax=Hermanssonia centrifuga TaxID=98765 RepID=A0A2R6S3T4_9APHY|nr:hypothetical protein PHLCEN_2v1217 [Hermanssonia centrifuga]
MLPSNLALCREQFQEISHGGKKHCGNQSLSDPSQDQSQWWKFKPSQMRAWESESEFASRIDGELGSSSETGKQTKEILAGQRLWGSNSWYERSSKLEPRSKPSESMETTKKLSKDGPTVTAEITKSTGIQASTQAPGISEQHNGPSRGIFPPERLLLPPIEIPGELQDFVVDFNSAEAIGVGEARRGQSKEPREKDRDARALRDIRLARQSEELTVASWKFDADQVQFN